MGAGEQAGLERIEKTFKQVWIGYLAVIGAYVLYNAAYMLFAEADSGVLSLIEGETLLAATVVSGAILSIVNFTLAWRWKSRLLSLAAALVCAGFLLVDGVAWLKLQQITLDLAVGTAVNAAQCALALAAFGLSWRFHRLSGRRVRWKNTAITTALVATYALGWGVALRLFANLPGIAPALREMVLAQQFGWWAIVVIFLQGAYILLLLALARRLPFTQRWPVMRMGGE